jgi:hypothetical protein
MGFWALLVASNKMIRKVFQDRCLHINPCTQCNPWFEFSSDRAKRGYPCTLRGAHRQTAGHTRHTTPAGTLGLLVAIRAINADNIAITGPGIIDGSGQAFYDTSRTDGKLSKPDTPRPRIGMFYHCRSLRLQDTTFVDSACWTLWLMQCQEVNIHRMACPAHDKAMSALLAHLTATEFRHPETGMRMIYELA